MTKNTPTKLIKEAAAKQGYVRLKEIQAQGIHPEYVRRLLRQGTLERVQRGIYTLADRPVTENSTLAEIARRAPQGVFCLLSALQFHQLTTQLPYGVWLAIEQKSRRPAIERYHLEVVRLSKTAFSAGIEKHQIEGIEVKVYTPAKTVADCFKFRHKVGLEVALEAMEEGWRGKRFTAQELWRMAAVCRVETVMRPYMEAILR